MLYPSVLPDSLTDQIPGFLVTLVSNCASIYDINIRFGMKFPHFITGLNELGSDGIRFVLVKPAANCFKCDPFLHYYGSELKYSSRQS